MPERSGPSNARPYLDSGVIAKLYVREVDSETVIRQLQPLPTPYVFTPWHGLEVRNALRLKLFRKEIDPEQLAASLTALEEDLDTDLWKQPIIHHSRALQVAEELSASHASRLGCRSLDIIHVAAAKILDATPFITLDKRQSALARAAGLPVRTLRRSCRPRQS